MKKDLFEEKAKQTVSKHNILKNYLEPWAKIISNQSWVKNAYYVDAFAGTGKYFKTGEAGSPILASEILIKCQTPTCKFHCFCIEKNKKRYQILLDSLEKFKNRIDIKPYNNEFLNVIDKILSDIAGFPAIFFIDPEGFSGLDFNKIEAILNSPHKEVLINFQYNAIQRWLKAAKVEHAITKLFGTQDYKKMRSETELIKLYASQIKSKGFFVWVFKNKFPEKNRTFYYLIYATENITGFKIMKSVMFGEQSRRYFEPSLFKEVDFQTFQKQIYDRYKTRKSVEYYEVLAFVLQDTNYLAKDLNKVLKNIGAKKRTNPQNQYNPFLDFPNHSIGNPLILKDPSVEYKTVDLKFSNFPAKPLKISYRDYQLINGSKKTLAQQVNDGSIITRFDKTPLPQKATDVICPHFLELKWAYGCPYDCSWCYLKGTFRFRPERLKPAFKDREKIELHVKTFLEEVKEPEILNTGEIADSLMGENGVNPFSKFIIPMFETQKKHKVLFVTKSNRIKYLLEIEPHNQVIVSFSLNALSVAEEWEKRAPKVEDRIKAAKQLVEAGYEVRLRIDPMVPIENWEKHYRELIDRVFSKFIPERITFGSLRGLQSTINGTKDTSWVKYLKETSNWGKKIDFTTRLKMYSEVIGYLKKEYNYKQIALCKETLAMWKKLKMDYTKIKCNCI